MAGYDYRTCARPVRSLTAHRDKIEKMAGTMVTGARPALAMHSVVQDASRHR